MFKKLFTQEEGFTLVELLVTIAIVSILFGITTLTLSGISTKAQTDMCANEVFVVQSAIDIFQAAYPGTAVTVFSDTVITAGGTNFAQYLKTDTLGEYTTDAAGTLTVGSCPP